MIISGRFLSSDPLETYHARWDEVHDRAYRPKWLTRYDLRERRGRFWKACHADWIWTKWLGRVQIAKTRRRTA